MSRLTLGNVLKVGLVVLFLPLIAYLVLLIGGVKKKLGVILEGLLYAAGFAAGIFVLDIIGLGGVLALASMGVSAVRSWHLRDLWLPARRRWWHRFVPVESRQGRVADAPPAEAALEGADGRAAALSWVGASAKQNRLRLPTGAYATFLETCQMLDGVVEAERREPTRDPRFEYELDALVREYLPGVLRGYLAIPPDMVESRQPNGRTPNEELAEQLRLLAAQAKTLHTSRHSRTPAQLTTTGNFLREKYGDLHRNAFDFGVK
ncbi:hypothetical protein M3148_00155 [Georgenia satyanarayanai]|uniref:hypothetical protein n=1 Tax=Georgenia satyanarayanai TaxID=860221 RepID=UPI00204016D7|nr:hypothetical protein [Georgenia satyanarayanai]MCM3659413.1 hypothetical protein [Georgenia satyanarayanai]